MSSNNNTMSSNNNNNVSSSSSDNVELEDIVNTFETLVAKDWYLAKHNNKYIKTPIETHRERIKTFTTMWRSETYQQSEQFDNMLVDCIFDCQHEVAHKLLQYFIGHICDEHLHTQLYVNGTLRRCLDQGVYDVLSLILDNIDLFRLEPVDAYIVKAVVYHGNLECMRTLFRRQNFENMHKAQVRSLASYAAGNGNKEFALYLLLRCDITDCSYTDCPCGGGDSLDVQNCDTYCEIAECKWEYKHYLRECKRFRMYDNCGDEDEEDSEYEDEEDSDYEEDNYDEVDNYFDSKFDNYPNDYPNKKC